MGDTPRVPSAAQTEQLCSNLAPRGFTSCPFLLSCSHFFVYWEQAGWVTLLCRRWWECAGAASPTSSPTAALMRSGSR